MKFWYNKYFWLLVTIVIFAADRVSKILVAKNLVLNLPLGVFSNFNLFYTQNTGAAFSFLNDAGSWHTWLFIVIGMVAICLLVFWELQITANRWLQFTLALILGGTLGNVFDRVVYGYVIDFLDFYFGIWHYPAFNLADSAICVGAAMLAIDIFIKRKTTANTLD